MNKLYPTFSIAFFILEPKMVGHILAVQQVLEVEHLRSCQVVVLGIVVDG
jgi:hypothetical protein